MSNHFSDDAFQNYHKKQLYIDTFVHAVDSGDHEIGFHRVLSVIVRRFPRMYLQIGKEQGMAFVNNVDKVSLAVMAIDCNCKHGQLKMY